MLASSGYFHKASGNLESHMLASSGYFHKASGNLESHMLNSSGYFHKASGNLESHMLAGSGYLKELIDTNGFTLRADDDAGAGGESITNGEVVTISGGDYITTDRDGSDAGKIVVAWSGYDNAYNWLGLPSTTFTAGSAATDIDGQSNDFYIVMNSGFSTPGGSWGKMTLTELDQLVGGGGASSSSDSFGQIQFGTDGLSFSSASTIDSEGADSVLRLSVDEKSDLYLETDTDNKAIRFSSHGSVSGSLQQSGTFIKEFAISYADAAQASGAANRVYAIEYTNAVSGYFSDASGNLESHMLNSSGYFHKASGNLHSMIYDSGVHNYGRAVAYTNAASGYFSDASGNLESHMLNSSGYFHKASGNLESFILASSGYFHKASGNLYNLASSTTNTFNKVTASGKSLAGEGALSTLDTCEADSTSDTLILTSGDNNAIYLFANPTEDSIMVSGAHRFWANADNLASGAINHDDMITFSGGASINTTLTNNVLTIDWAGDSAYTTDLELMAVSGYFSKASGNLESHMLSSSGYFHKASGNLMGEIRASGAWNAAYTRSASGYFHKASGNLHSMIYDSGVTNRAYTRSASGYFHKASGNLESHMLNSSGYFHKASGNLESHMLNASGYFHKASGNLMGEIRASGAWNAAYTRSASGWNTEYTNAASGWATYEGISGIDLYNGTGGATRRFGISEDWLSKPAFTDSEVETINIGFNAGINPGLPNRMNINFGPRAGAQESNSAMYLGTVNLGTDAGAKLQGGQGQSYSVNIGYSAGYTEQQDNLPAGFAAEQSNIFIGYSAGQNSAFSNNLSIGTFKDNIGDDAINNDYFRISDPGTHFTNGYMLNISNSIAGNMDSVTTGKRFVIGKVDKDTTFDHTLKLVPAGSMATTSTFHIARNTSQAGNMMTTEVSSAVFFVDEGINDRRSTVVSETRTENYTINKNGYLTIPMFASKSDLPIASDNPGMIAMYRTAGEGHQGQYKSDQGRNGHFMVFSDGRVWRATGAEQAGGGSKLP